MCAARIRPELLPVVIALLLAGPCLSAATDFPRLRLENGIIAVSIFLPDAQTGYYRGTRFDWSGIIERVDYRGHRFYAPLHESHDPTGHDHVSGPATEFAMFAPPGYAEARPGEAFVKIGVGLLARGNEENYSFKGDYRLLRAGDWSIDHGPDWVSFDQQLDGPRGWAYRYRKTIRLLRGEAAFVMSHRLENRGRKTIEITHYNHNFTLIDEVPYGPAYTIEFPFATPKTVQIGDFARFRGNKIEVEKPLGDASLWSVLFEGTDPGGYNAARVRNDRTGAEVAFEGDAPLARMVFWAVERAACPEPFVRLKLSPGDSRTWAIRYRFHAD